MHFVEHHSLCHSALHLLRGLVAISDVYLEFSTMHQIPFWLRLHPRPRCAAYSTLPDLYLDLRGPSSN